MGARRDESVLSGVMMILGGVNCSVGGSYGTLTGVRERFGVEGGESERRGDFDFLDVGRRVSVGLVGDGVDNDTAELVLLCSPLTALVVAEHCWNRLRWVFQSP